MVKATKITPARAPASAAASPRLDPVGEERRVELWNAYLAADDCVFTMLLLSANLQNILHIGPKSAVKVFTDFECKRRLPASAAGLAWDQIWNVFITGMAEMLDELDRRHERLEGLLLSARPPSQQVYNVHDDAIRVGTIAAASAIDATQELGASLMLSILHKVPHRKDGPPPHPRGAAAIEAILRDVGHPALCDAVRRLPELRQDLQALGIRLGREQSAVETLMLGHIEDGDLSAAERLIWRALKCAAKSAEDLVAVIGHTPNARSDPKQVVFNHVASIRKKRGSRAIASTGGWYTRPDAPPPSPPPPRRRRHGVRND